MPPRHFTVRNSFSPARILLVDDNMAGLSARKCVLEELGHSISVACCGAEALEQFAPYKFDVVVTDYKMPSMDGKELIVRLRALQPDLPVIMVSGFSDALGLDEKSTGADTVIQKSNNEVSHLVRAVARLLKRKSSKPVAKPQATPLNNAPPNVATPSAAPPADTHSDAVKKPMGSAPPSSAKANTANGNN